MPANDSFLPYRVPVISKCSVYDEINKLDCQKHFEKGYDSRDVIDTARLFEWLLAFAVLVLWLVLIARFWTKWKYHIHFESDTRWYRWARKRPIASKITAQAVVRASITASLFADLAATRGDLGRPLPQQKKKKANSTEEAEVTIETTPLTTATSQQDTAVKSLAEATIRLWTTALDGHYHLGGLPALATADQPAERPNALVTENRAVRFATDTFNGRRQSAVYGGTALRNSLLKQPNIAEQTPSPLADPAATSDRRLPEFLQYGNARRSVSNNSDVTITVFPVPGDASAETPQGQHVASAKIGAVSGSEAHLSPSPQRGDHVNSDDAISFADEDDLCDVRFQ